MYINNIKVDSYQEKAILCQKNVLLIAGAGAGKTFTIIGKLNYLIETLGYKENEILIISFTNKSVDDLKKKIKYKVDIYTFHKLAMEILKYHQTEFSIAAASTLEYLTNEFFTTLQDQLLKKEILKYYKYLNYEQFLQSYKYKELLKLIITFISIFKTNDCTLANIKKAFNNNPFLVKLILIILKLYENELSSSGKLDFDDIIKKATDNLQAFYKYKYIIIDEFQDTSFLRWNLANKLRTINNAKIFVVGDDYQSIYHFSGCDINIFLDFSKLVPETEVLRLKYTYRNAQDLIDVAGKFVMKNKNQIPKKLISNISIKDPIKIIKYWNQSKCLSKILDRLIKKYDEILILGRNTKDIYNYIKNINIKDNSFIYKNHSIKYLTVHSSKGLEADCVIIINLIDSVMGFPNKLTNNKLIDTIHPITDTFLYAEERRLFYVALTRTKNEVFLLTPHSNSSIFVKEIKKYL